MRDRLLRSPAAIIGASILIAFLLISVVGQLVVPYPPGDTTWSHLIKDSENLIPGPSAQHWLGLDHLGRDELSRMVVGAWNTLLVGVIATLIGLLIGCLVGGVSGAAYGLGGASGRRLDNALMRVIDMFLAIPSLLLAISIVAILGAGQFTVMVAVGFTSIPIFARLLRGSMIAQSNAEYVTAATSLGVSKTKTALSHVLPNSIAPVLVQMTLTLATAIIEAAGLSFLGLGNPDSKTPEWGVMLNDALDRFDYAPMLAVYPALGIIVTALGFTLLGESMREALDPKLRR